MSTSASLHYIFLLKRN